MSSNIFDDFDEQSQEELQGYNFISLEDLQRGIIGVDPFAEIRTNKTAREIFNEIALETPLGKRSAFYKPEYVSENIDFQKLVAFISKKQDAVFNWKHFIGYTSKTTTYKTSFGEEAKFDRMSAIPTSYTITKDVKTEKVLKTKDSGKRILELNGRLNKEIALVNINKDNNKDLTNGLEFEFNYKRQKVSYKLHYYYVGRKRVYKKDNKGEIAFTISSSSFEDFEAFIKQSKLQINENSNFKQQIKDAFFNAIKAVNKLPKKKKQGKGEEEKEYYNYKKFSALDWLYIKIPQFVAVDLDFDETLLNVFLLDEWDRSISLGRDTTQSITTILSRLNPYKVYDYFYQNPQRLIKLITEFDDEIYAEQFFQYLTVIALYKQGADNLENARVFSINERAHIETNILYGDEEGKVELTNEFDLSGIASAPAATGIDIVSYFREDLEINNPQNRSNQFHPLDIIYLQQYDPEIDEAIKVPSVAIYGKYLGDKTEWSDVMTATFAVIDLVSIVLSAGALSAGIRGIRAAFAITDIAISTINLVTLSPTVKKELSKTEAGKWFVAHWPLLSFCVSGGMISVYLAKGILKYGSSVKGQFKNNPKLSKNIDELVEESKRVLVEEKAINLNFEKQLGKQAGKILDETILPSIITKIRKSTAFKEFNIVVVDRNNFKFKNLFKAWQKKPKSYAVFARRKTSYLGEKLNGQTIYFFKGSTSLGDVTIFNHTFQHELFHVEMHAKLIEKLGLQKYLQLDAKIPTHIREEYVTHRLLNSNSKAVDLNEIDVEIFRINKNYRPLNGIKNSPLDENYLKNEWNLRNELKKLGINY